MRGTVKKVFFHFINVSFALKERNRLRSFILEQLLKEGRDVETINYIFCNDAYLLNLNREYLKHDTLTDIITFEFSPKSHPLMSDIFISVDRIRENCLLYKSSFRDEIHRVMFHGALHLVGYKDKKASDKRLMIEKEQEYLNAYFIPRGTSTRRQKD